MTWHRKLCIFLAVTIPVFGTPALSKDGRPVAPAGSVVCGTSTDRVQDVLARAKYQQSRLRLLAASSGKSTLFKPRQAALLQDIGDVTVMEDDGTIISVPNPFDLTGKSFQFVPVDLSTYRLAATSTPFDGTGGSTVSLKDDDSFALALTFSFTFYGKSYTSIQINSDGNLTFLQADTSSSDRNLGRFSSGPPRIGPFFTDLDPSSGGAVTYRYDSDGVLIAWNGVPSWSSGVPSEFNSFSVKLFRGGVIEFAYGSRVTTGAAVIGISPGNSQGGISAVDYSTLPPVTSPTQAIGGTIAEVFATAEVVSETSVAIKFLRTHPDAFDHLNLFLGFQYDLGSNAFAYELPVKNEIQGIGNIIPGKPVFDFSADYGSSGRLRSFLNMGTLSRYPADPNQYVLFTNTTMGVMGQESGHRWEAFTHFLDGTVDSTEILGRDLAHWSFFFNSDGSVMEGNQIVDQGAGKGNQRFLTVNATYTFSKLDQYIMGLLPPELVPPMFLVSSPSGAPGFGASSHPQIGVTFGGIRKDFTIDSIIAANGPRIPPSYQAPKVFRQAFIYLLRRGQTPDPAQIAKVQRIRDSWVSFFNTQTGQRGWVVTDLQDSAATLPSRMLIPYFQAGANRYTGIAVANWGATPADVLFTAYDNSGTPLASPSTVINPRMMTIPPGAQIAVVAEQLLGLSQTDPHNGWIDARSTSSQVRGFFLDGDSAQTMLSGAVADNRTATTLYFVRGQVSSSSRSGNTYRNLINVVNPDSAHQAQLRFSYYSDAGSFVQTSTRTLAPNGRLSEDITSLVQGLAPPHDSGYLVMTSDIAVAGYQSIDTGKTIFALPATSSSSSSNLYSAQFASGPAGSTRYFSQLNLINTSAQPRSVQLLLVGNDGNPVAGTNNPASLPVLAPGQQYQSMGNAVFGLADPAVAANIVEGSVVVLADGPGIVGDVAFGDPVEGKFIAALPLDGNPASSLILSQVAQGSAGGGKSYFTGVAMYNPGNSDITAALDVYSASGSKIGSASIPLAQGHRLSKTLDELVPAAQGQIGGYIRISVSGGAVVSYGLFGTQSLDFLAAIPAQPLE